MYVSISVADAQLDTLGDLQIHLYLMTVISIVQLNDAGANCNATFFLF